MRRRDLLRNHPALRCTQQDQPQFRILVSKRKHRKNVACPLHMGKQRQLAVQYCQQGSGIRTLDQRILFTAAEARWIAAIFFALGQSITQHGESSRAAASRIPTALLAKFDKFEGSWARDGFGSQADDGALAAENRPCGFRRYYGPRDSPGTLQTQDGRAG